MTAPAHTYRLDALTEDSNCARCTVYLEVGDIALHFRGEIFCCEACMRLAIYDDEHVVLGGEAG